MTGSYRKKDRCKVGKGKDCHGLARLVVRAKPGDPSKGLLVAGNTVFPCALGRSGISSGKREGDGATPLGPMRLVSGYFRGDHVAGRRTRLPMKPIAANLGWCDRADDRNYNRPVKMPYAASHEEMHRKDRLYDYCLVLDWNVTTRRRGKGSAIFLHLAKPGFTPTEGCVAVTASAMARLLPKLTSRTVLDVRR